jgi:hypothetical protein
MLGRRSHEGRPYVVQSDLWRRVIASYVGTLVLLAIMIFSYGTQYGDPVPPHSVPLIVVPEQP